EVKTSPAVALLCVLLLVIGASLAWVSTRRLHPRGDGAAPVDPRRIVSMAPSLTEMLLYLGARDRLVGVTVHCQGVGPELPRVGSFLEPDLERIVALRPDLVLGIASRTQSPLFATLGRLAIPTEVIPSETVEDVRRAAVRLSALVGAEERSRAFIARLDRATASPPPGEHPLRAAFVVQRGPIFVAGGGSFIDEMLAAAAIKNVFHDREEAYLAVDLEEIIRRDPDLILDTHPRADATGPVAGEDPYWRRFSRLRAVREGGIVPFQEVWPGIGIPAWIEELKGVAARRRP
ncbi:MAG: ABC transporter substrate-binding protein, partial [Planctomycetota bacterium]